MVDAGLRRKAGRLVPCSFNLREGTALERRIYFVIGDLLASTSAGTLAGLAVTAAVGPGWNPVFGAVAGMSIGMGVALVLALACFVIPFGAFEIMLPATLSGALAGMVAGMVAALRGLSIEGGAVIGALLGVAVLIYTYAMNARARRASERANRPPGGARQGTNPIAGE